MTIKKFVLSLAITVVAVTAHAQDPPCESYICIEAETGTVISEYNADVRRPPASMIKLMMMLMVAEGVEVGQWGWDTEVTATLKAERMGGTQVYIGRGETYTVDRLMVAAAVASANDATMALAEGLWGSEEAYLAAMNARAKELGMIDSEFSSVHGLPPDAGEEFDKTTARDMAVLGQWIVRRPELMELTKLKVMEFRPGESLKYNTNKMLWRMEDCDGLKTGYIRAAGFCLTATATREGKRVIAVLMGCENKNTRFKFAEHLLDNGLKSVRHATVIRASQPAQVDIPIRNARKPTFQPIAAEDLTVVVTRDEESKIEVNATVVERLTAPVAAGTPVGKLVVSVDGHPRGEVALVVGKDIAEPTWKWKLLQAAPTAGK